MPTAVQNKLLHYIDIIKAPGGHQGPGGHLSHLLNLVSTFYSFGFSCYALSIFVRERYSAGMSSWGDGVRWFSVALGLDGWLQSFVCDAPDRTLCICEGGNVFLLDSSAGLQMNPLAPHFRSLQGVFCCRCLYSLHLCMPLSALSCMSRAGPPLKMCCI